MFYFHPSLWFILVGGFLYFLFRMSIPAPGKKRSSCSYDVCLNKYSKLLIACNFLSPMNANGAVGDGYVISFIKYSATLVADYWLDNPGILFFSRENSTLSAIHSALVLLTYNVYHLKISIDDTKYHPSTTCGSQDLHCPGFFCITTLVPGGARGVLSK